MTQLRSSVETQAVRVSSWLSAQGLMPGASDMSGLARQALSSVGRVTSWVGTAFGALTTIPEYVFVAFQGTFAAITVALIDDYDVVVQGVANMLEPYRDRVVVAELDASTPLKDTVDIALYDSFAQPESDHEEIGVLVANPCARRVVVYTWNFHPDLIASARERGAHGYLSKTLPASELVAALERVHAGETIVSAEVGTGPIAGEWPGREEGLTPREAEVLALITQGLSNNEIAAQTHLSINSVKSYIRTGYRKIGVTSRSQAVLWGVRHGFEPDHRRIVAGSQNGL